MFRRIRNLWRLSNIDVAYLTNKDGAVEVSLATYHKPRGKAKIVQDKPKDLFPSLDEELK